MSENSWIVTVEKTQDRFVMTFCGKVQLGLKALILGLTGLGVVVATIKQYFMT